MASHLTLLARLPSLEDRWEREGPGWRTGRHTLQSRDSLRPKGFPRKTVETKARVSRDRLLEVALAKAHTQGEKWSGSNGQAVRTQDYIQSQGTSGFTARQHWNWSTCLGSTVRGPRNKRSVRAALE